MDQNFYNLLYNGYTGEFQLIGALYRNGLDALRPPADMGVDVVTVNLKAQLQDPSVQPETLMFQVKTAVVTVQEAGEGVRGYTTVYFMLKESEVDMLCAARTRALVCYVYDNRNSMLTDAYASCVNRVLSPRPTTPSSRLPVSCASLPTKRATGTRRLSTKRAERLTTDIWEVSRPMAT